MTDPVAGGTNAVDDLGCANMASARKVVLGCVCSALGQPRQSPSVETIAAALGAELAAAAADHDDLLPAQLMQTVEGALSRATQQLISRGVSSDHVLKLVEKVRQELAHACGDVTHAAAAAAAAR
jgi:hypothetical protein